MKIQRVLFLCTGNSARSQMAEGLVNHFLADRWEAKSAGSEPAGYVHPFAIAVMAEIGIDISQQRSKPTSEFRRAEFNLVITLCDDACQKCAVWLGRGERTHIGFSDPAAAAGSPEDRLAAFRQVRDDIQRRVFAYLEQYQAGAPVGAAR